jgi:MFS family permease
MSRWLTRNVFAIGMLSLFSDMGHEMLTAVLPLFLAQFGGAAALGTIEGVSDAASSLVKLWMSHHSDRIGRRKPIMVVGYILTAIMGLFAFVTAWWQILLLRGVAWMGRGARGPVRDALLAESVPSEARGRAFGFERAMDTLGAIIGPAVALSLVGTLSYRHIFLIAFLPGAITVLVVTLVLRDIMHPPDHTLRLLASLRALPADFWRYAGAVGVFGLGNFAHTLLILRAVALLTPAYGKAPAAQLALGLYIFHNVLYAGISYPAGVLADRGNKRRLLAVGYALFGVMCLGFLAAGSSLGALVILFALAGVYIAIVDTVERALAADLLPEPALRGTGFGALATVNSFGDLVSSIAVGLLWQHVSFAAGFAYGAALTLIGAVLLFTLRLPAAVAHSG